MCGFETPKIHEISAYHHVREYTTHSYDCDMTQGRVKKIHEISAYHHVRIYDSLLRET